MAVTPGGAKKKLVTAMASGTIPQESVPQEGYQAVQEWTNTYRRLDRQAGAKGQNVQQLMMQNAGAPRASGGGPIKPRMNPPKARDDAVKYLVGLYLRQTLGRQGLFYGK